MQHEKLNSAAAGEVTRDPMALPPEILEMVKAGMPFDLIVLTREHIAGMLGCHPASVTKMWARGKMKSFRSGPAGGQPRTTLADYAAFVSEQRNKGGNVMQKLAPNPHRRRGKLRVVDSGASEPWLDDVS